ncbi:MAG TPA: CHRD domain-containing protein [Gemmatimonadaceae bacterium]|nr:CHRD domain-containing protein [Gemmatimonadaceae bacterium]
MLVFPLLGCSAFTEPGPEHYSAVLSVDATRSPVTNAANASGDALFSRRRELLDLVINVSGLSSNATAAHIHGPAAPGAVAEILVSFFVVPGTKDARVAGGVVSATASPGVSLDSVFVLMRNGSAYVDVHTELNPDGEIFGQIERGYPISTEP